MLPFLCSEVHILEDVLVVSKRAQLRFYRGVSLLLSQIRVFTAVFAIPAFLESPGALQFAWYGMSRILFQSVNLLQILRPPQPESYHSGIYDRQVLVAKLRL